MAESGVLRIVSPDERVNMDRVEAENARAQQEAALPAQEELGDLVAHLRRLWDEYRNHRNTVGINDRLLHSMRTFNGQYDSAKLAEIREFGGSEVYARVTATKCRGTTSMLRDVYMGVEKPWGLQPTPDPVLPDDIMASVSQLVLTEVQNLAASGQPIDKDMIDQRMDMLMDAARQANMKKAVKETEVAEKKIDDLLVQGGFYEALAQHIVDVPIFPYAVIKGPVVRHVPEVKWQDGKAMVRNKAKMFWERVNPFYFYWSPGVAFIEDASTFEKIPMTRTDLNDLMGLPGYDEDAIRGALKDYGDKGHHEWWDTPDTEQAEMESRENPWFNRSGMIDSIEFNGQLQGKMLKEYGIKDPVIKDEDRDYMVTVRIVGRYVIKVEFNPSPRKRHPYYVTSFEKVPGTTVGNSLVDILADIQDVCNVTMRSLVNNLSIASGPQVMINTDRLAEAEEDDMLYPWKRWHYDEDPVSNNSRPIDFFQPSSNANELLGVYERFTHYADDISAIPRYVTGNERLGGAGRTASGLAMLMGNANKILQTVASNIDNDVISPMLHSLYDMVMLTTNELRGDEEIHVRGVSVALQKETDRMRQLEFLQITANPIDMQIMGIEGRAKVLESVSDTIGMKGEDIVPNEQQLAQMQREQRLAQQQQAAAQAQGDQAPKGGQQGAPVDNIASAMSGTKG